MIRPPEGTPNDLKLWCKYGIAGAEAAIRPAHNTSFRLMGENVLFGPAGQIEPGARRQKFECRLRQRRPPLTRQHRIEALAQRMQVQDIGGGIAQLLVGEQRCAPIRALLLF